MGTQINQLPVASSVASTDTLPAQQSAGTRQLTPAQIMTGGVTSLPTTLPATAGILWNNGGFLCTSQP